VLGDTSSQIAVRAAVVGHGTVVDVITVMIMIAAAEDDVTSSPNAARTSSPSLGAVLNGEDIDCGNMAYKHQLQHVHALMFVYYLYNTVQGYLVVTT